MKPSPLSLVVFTLAAGALVACGGERGPADERFRTQTPDDSGPSEAEPAAPARPGGEVAPVEYDSKGNVADVEDRGENCPIPELPGFDDLQDEPLLPDPFASLSGSRIEEKKAWTCRRAEISAQVQAYELGPKPPKPKHVSGSLRGNELTVSVDDGGESIAFTATLTPPAEGDGPFPAMIVLGGTTALDSEGTISGQGVTMILYTDGGFADVTDEWVDWDTPNLE